MSLRTAHSNASQWDSNVEIGSVFVFHVSLYAFVCCNDIVH